MTALSMTTSKVHSIVSIGANKAPSVQETFFSMEMVHMVETAISYSWLGKKLAGQNWLQCANL